MTIQEQEELDHEVGAFKNEFQAAYSLSQLSRKPDHKARIAELQAQGKFIVVFEITEYCPHTDAILGARHTIVSVHDTQEAAQAALPTFADDSEAGHFIARPASKLPVVEEEHDLPF